MQIHDTLRHYSYVIRHYAGLIMLGVTFVTVVTCGINLFITPIYQAKALIKVNVTTTTTTSDVFSAQAQAVSYALLITDPEVIHQAGQQLSWITLDEINKAISASPVDNTQIIEVRAQANSAQKAANIANAVVNAFIQVQEAKETSHIQNASDQLAQDLAQTKIALDAAQQRLTTLQGTHVNEQEIAQQRSVVDTNQTNYTSLLANYNQLQTQKLQTNDMLRVAQVATPPEQSISPQVLVNTLLAAGVSLLLMFALALLLDWMDATIKTNEDVIHLAALKPLGSIPLSPSTESANNLLDLSLESSDMLREHFTMLGASFRALSKEPKAIIVTGLHQKIGATTTATYLAMSLAQSGLRVLLIDANLRRPLLHSIFQVPNGSGLTNRLKDIERFEEQPQRLPLAWLNQWVTHFPNLWLLPAGPSPSHPTAILRMPELGQLTEWLLGRHPKLIERSLPGIVDLIIFDSSALDDNVDTQALTMAADETVLVIKAGKEQRETLQQLQNTLQRLEAPILGVVINCQKVGQQSYFYVDKSTTTRESEQPISIVREKIVAVPGVERAMMPLAGELARAQIRQQQGPKSPLQEARERMLQGKYTPVLERIMSTETPPVPFPVPAKATDVLPTYLMHNEVNKSQPTKMQFQPLLRTRGASLQGVENEQKL